MNLTEKKLMTTTDDLPIEDSHRLVWDFQGNQVFKEIKQEQSQKFKQFDNEQNVLDDGFPLEIK